MPLPGRFCRVFVYADTEMSDEGFEVHVRHDSRNGHVNPSAFARLICAEIESASAVLQALRVDGVSRFVRESDGGPLFEYLSADFGQLTNLIERLGTSEPKSITLIASDLSDEETAARIEAARTVLSRPNLAMEPTARN